MKALIYFIIPGLLFCTFCTNCNKDCITSHYFELPIEAYGISDTLNINDTIRIKFTIPDKLKERDTQDFYDFVNYDFKLITVTIRLDSIPVSSVTESDFDWITIKGNSTFASNDYLVTPSYSNHEYQYEVRIIPKKKGLFEFSINSIAHDRINPLAKPNGRCSKGTFHVVMKLQNNIDVNYEFLQESTSSVYKKLDRKRFDEYAGICFYVR
jgi:hypothetical protein